jgi:hypothetical protein
VSNVDGEESVLIDGENNHPNSDLESMQSSGTVKDLAKKLDLFFSVGNAPIPGAIASRNRAATVSSSFSNAKDMVERLRSGSTPCENSKASRSSSFDTARAQLKEAFLGRTTEEVSLTETLKQDGPAHRPLHGKPLEDAKEKIAFILAEGVTVHELLMQDVEKNLKRSFRRRGTFANKINEQEDATHRIGSFWVRFKKVLNGKYFSKNTSSSIIGTILLALVEARQAFFDVYEFGKGLGESTKTIEKNPMLRNMGATIAKLEKAFDHILWTLGHQTASDVSRISFSTMKVKGQFDFDKLAASCDDAKTEFKASPIVEAPILLLEERLSTFDQDILAPICPDLLKLQQSTQGFVNQGYDESVVLMYVAETVGKAIQEVIHHSELRHRLYQPLMQTFSSARANAMALFQHQS